MNNTIISLEQVESAQQVVDMFMADERSNVEECISEDIEEDEIPGDLGSMTDDELYHFCKENDIDHIWCHLYQLSKIQ